MSHFLSNKLQNILNNIHFRTQVVRGATLTHDDLAEIAGVSGRSLGDWMRGVTAPMGMCAVFQLLSQLPERDVNEILNLWRSDSIGDSAKLIKKEIPARSGAHTKGIKRAKKKKVI